MSSQVYLKKKKLSSNYIFILTDSTIALTNGNNKMHNNENCNSPKDVFHILVMSYLILKLIY